LGSSGCLGSGGMQGINLANEKVNFCPLLAANLLDLIKKIKHYLLSHDTLKFPNIIYMYKNMKTGNFIIKF